MKKKIICYLLFGFSSGVFISQTILLLMCTIFSLSTQQYIFSAAPPEFINQMGNELFAAITQYFLAGLLGAGFSVSSLIWQMNKWSPLKKSLLHFLILSCIMLPIAWFAYWMPHTLFGTILYFVIFTAIYFIIYVIIEIFTHAKIKKLNKSLQEKN